MVDRPGPLGAAERFSAPVGGGDTPGRLDARARMTMALLYRRLLEMGIWRHIHSVGGAVTAGSGGAHFTTRDNPAFLDELLSRGRFCRDTPGGGLLHRGRISVREITDGPALHLSLADDNRIYVHVDRISPAIHATEDGTCRYDRHRSLSHMRQEVFPLVMRSYRPSGEETKRTRQARLDLYDAQRAWCEAVEAGRKEESIESGLRLAGLLAAEKESARLQAQTLYRQAMASGHRDLAPAAAFGLGALLEERNEIPRAIEAYRTALASGHPEFGPWAAYNLGIVLEKTGRTAEAMQCLERAISFGHPDLTSWAALKLGDLAAGSGETDRALEAYRLTTSLRHPECASVGAISAARLLRRTGKTKTAEAAYEQAIALGPPETAAAATRELEQMRNLEKRR